MIKKLNIFLAIVFSLMFGLKGLKEIKASRAKESHSSAPVASGQAKSSGLDPYVCYSYWAGYSLEDPISNRNGVLLDTIKAIFPNATFHRLFGNVEEFAKILRENPKAVVVGFGAHPALKGLCVAPTPISSSPIVLMTLRTNPWQYKGQASLDSLRILTNEAFLDYKVLRDLIKQYGRDSQHLRIMPASVSKLELAEMVEKGEADAFVTTGMNDAAGALMDGIASVRILQRFRKSKVISVDGTFLYVSGIDAAFSKSVIEEYEKGIRRLDVSGQRRRIFEYYGMEYSPVQND